MILPGRGWSKKENPRSVAFERGEDANLGRENADRKKLQKDPGKIKHQPFTRRANQ